MRFVGFMILGGMLCLFSLSQARATDELVSPQSLGEREQRIIHLYQEALKNEDIEQLKSLYHPKSLACQAQYGKKGKDPDFLYKMKVSRPLSESILVKFSDQPEPLPGAWTYPLTPTHQFYIKSISAYGVPGENTTPPDITSAVVLENGTYYLVEPCPTFLKPSDL